MKRQGLNKSGAAKALGIARNSLQAYLSGAKIPRAVALACAAIAVGLPEHP
jgi:transcriptional regulator with XRE-family HTH domain